jgi:hypothetical protein
MIIDAAGATGDDDAANAGKLIGTGIAAKNSGRNAQVTNLAGDQVAVLPTCVEDCYLSRSAYFFTLSATIFLAFASSAVALGRALTAASTSGSMRIS